MRVRVQLFAIALGMALLAGVGLAQERLSTNTRGDSTIRGHVRDSSGHAIPGVRIVATASGIDETTTDERGNYVLEKLKEDTYIISVEIRELTADVKAVRATTTMPATADFTMTPRAAGAGGIAPTVWPTRVVQNTVNDRVSLQLSLNNSIEKWPLASVVPVSNGTSIFTFGPTAASRQPDPVGPVRIIAVANKFDQESLSKQLALYPGRSFIGVHRVTDSAYLLFLR